MLMMYLALIDNNEDVLVFENIYHTYRQQMIYVAESILGNFDDAEDAVQIALFGIAKSFKCVPITDDARLRAYVLTAAKNAACAADRAVKLDVSQFPGQHTVAN